MEQHADLEKVVKSMYFLLIFYTLMRVSATRNLCFEEFIFMCTYTCVQRHKYMISKSDVHGFTLSNTSLCTKDIV